MSVPDWQQAVLQASTEVARQHADEGRDGAAPADPMAALGAALKLRGLSVTAARIVGRGSMASADITLSNGQTMTFERVRDMATPRALALELTMATEGKIIEGFKGDEALTAVARLRAAATYSEALTADDLAIQLGAEYLRHARPSMVRMQDQADRWRAFREFDHWDPFKEARLAGVDLIDAQMMLVDETSGERFVRTGWLWEVARHREPRGEGAPMVLTRMLRVGWTRRASRGRIKATDPSGLARPLGWNFLIAPDGWEDEH